jgi:hypothetical protein
MGLAVNADVIPLHCEMLCSNKLDKKTFQSLIREVRKNSVTAE